MATLMSEDMTWGHSKAEQLASFLQDSIDNSELVSGQHLGTKQSLVDKYNVAAGTLNEALRLLQSRGYVEVRPGPKGGAFVADANKRIRLRHAIIQPQGDPEQMGQAVQVRDELEVIVAVEAARNCTPEDAKRIRKALEAISEVGDGRSHLSKIWDLHREIAKTGKNALLTSIYTSLMDLIEHSVQSVEMMESVPKGVSAETSKVHEELVEAIVKNDIEAAIVAARQHTPISKSYYINNGH